MNNKHKRTCKIEDGYGEQCAEGRMSNQVPQKQVSTEMSIIAKKKFKILEVLQLQNDAVKPTKKVPSIAIPPPSTQTQACISNAFILYMLMNADSARHFAL